MSKLSISFTILNIVLFAFRERERGNEKKCGMKWSKIWSVPFKQQEIYRKLFWNNFLLLIFIFSMTVECDLNV